MIIKIAFKNLLNTGIRLWINVIVIALSISIVIWTDALYEGFTNYSIESIKKSETGAGHLISDGFDFDDPLTWMDKKTKMPSEFLALYKNKTAYPVRFTPASLYFQSKKIMVTIKAIDHFQNALNLKVPEANNFFEKTGTWPVALGKEMIKDMRCKKGDIFTLTWKNSKGAYDAADFTVHTILNTRNPRIEQKSVWMDLSIFKNLMNENGLASYMVIKPGSLKIVKKISGDLKKWKLKTADQLTQWIRELERADKKNVFFIYSLLIFLCGVGVFNSQITEVFKRRKEIGTFMSLGLNNIKISLIFAAEGIITSIISISMVPIVGSPLFYWSVKYGINTDYAGGMGIPMPESIKSIYTFHDSLITLVIFFIILSIVSWLPVKQILKMKPAALICRK